MYDSSLQRTSRFYKYYRVNTSNGSCGSLEMGSTETEKARRQIRPSLVQTALARQRLCEERLYRDCDDSCYEYDWVQSYCDRKRQRLLEYTIYRDDGDESLDSRRNVKDLQGKPRRTRGFFDIQCGA